MARHTPTKSMTINPSRAGRLERICCINLSLGDWENFSEGVGVIVGGTVVDSAVGVAGGISCVGVLGRSGPGVRRGITSAGCWDISGV